jgi:hypothetical protein
VKLLIGWLDLAGAMKPAPEKKKEAAVSVLGIET